MSVTFAPEYAMPSDPSMTVLVDRDSVCAGDDVESHQVRLSVPASCDVRGLLALAWRACPLASIETERATWLIDAGGSDRCIGVMAQQWSRPRLLVPGDTRASELFAEREPTLHFRYWCQSDPDAVFEALRWGNPLPSRHSGPSDIPSPEAAWKPRLLAKARQALAGIEPLAAQDWPQMQSITRQLRWCIAFASDQPREERPDPFSMGLIATREFDMYGDQPDLARLINDIQREVEWALGQDVRPAARPARIGPGPVDARPDATRSRSVFVTALAWAAIVLSALATPISLVTQLMLLAHSPGAATGGLAGWLIVVAGPPAMLFAGIGLLRRKRWAYVYTVAALLLIIGHSLVDGARALFSPAMRTYVAPDGVPHTELGGSLLAFYALPVIAVCAWVLARLLSRQVRAEFALLR